MFTEENVTLSETVGVGSGKVQLTFRGVGLEPEDCAKP